MEAMDPPINECTTDSLTCRIHHPWVLVAFISVIFLLVVAAVILFIILRAHYRKMKLRQLQQERRRSSQTLPFYLGLGRGGGQGRADTSADVQLRRLSTRMPSIAERRQSRIVSSGTQDSSGTGAHSTPVGHQSVPRAMVRSESEDTLPRYDEVVSNEDQEAWAKARLYGGVGLAI